MKQTEVNALVETAKSAGWSVMYDLHSRENCVEVVLTKREKGDWMCRQIVLACSPESGASARTYRFDILAQGRGRPAIGARAAWAAIG